MKELSLTVSPKEAAIQEWLWAKVAVAAGCRAGELADVRIVRRSIDARKRGHVKLLLTVQVALAGETLELPACDFRFQDVSQATPVVIVGTGPAGLFAALRLIELGLKPVIVERGKEVGERKRDVAQLCRGQGLNPESNYCFGEGGAGTFSDGKLYTRSNKRGDVMRILQAFTYHGADGSILIDSHPHIGTDRLPDVVRNIRKTIVDCGGEIHFGQRFTGCRMADGRVAGIDTADGSRFEGKAVVLATGHSADDVYDWFAREGYLLEAKAFAMGVRVEHPQVLVNAMLYHGEPEREYLPAAAYTLTAQADGRGVYSFCMCPGGFMVPASTSEALLVVNGMSSAARNSPFANAGIVVETRPEDLPDYSQFGVLAGLRYRQDLEQMAFEHGGGRQTAPAQRLIDFMRGKASARLPECSYLPGVTASPMHEWLPADLAARLRKGFDCFNRRMTGFIGSDAVIVGVESRSSSPVRIPRDAATLQHPQLPGLYPCGEGAGYAGGITSSALDGTLVAESIALQHHAPVSQT